MDEGLARRTSRQAVLVHAGITAAAAGPRIAQSLLAGSAALGSACVASLPIAAHPRSAQLNRPGLLSGAREIIRQPTLRVITLTSTAGQVGPGALAVVAALLATSLHRPASGGLLLTAVATGSFAGSLLWTWHPIAPGRSALVMLSMIGIGIPTALAVAAPSIEITGALFVLSGFFIGPFGAALFTERTQYSEASVRTQVFTIGA